MTIIEYFESNGYLNIKETGKTWDELGEQFGMSGEAARKKMSRLWNNSNLENTTLPEEVPTKTFEPKILLFDIETAPMRSFTWKIWQENIGPLNGQLQSDWFMLCWSAKWLFADGTLSDKLISTEVKEEDDKRICESLWKLLDEAQIVIGHNCKKFDIKKVNTRFLKHGMVPPSSYKVIDTLEHAKKAFAFTSNKLDYVGKFLDVGRKIDTGGFELWERCMNGDGQALIEMSAYCDVDVLVLENFYLKIRPYIQPHPNLGLLITEDIQCCPSCTSTDLKWGGMYTTYTNSYKAFRCNHCGSIGRDRIPQKKHLNLAKPIPV